MQRSANTPTVRSDGFSRSTAKAVTTSTVGLLKPRALAESDRPAGVYTEPFFESLVICLDPTLYLKLKQQAGLAGKSLDQYIVDILEEVVPVTKQS